MTSKVTELLQEINDTLEDTANSLNPCFHRDFIGLDDVLADLISAAHAEGVAEERERIRGLGTLHDKGNGFPFYSVVASVLAPSTGPSDIDPFEGDYEADDLQDSVLAPTKESEKSYCAVGDSGEGGESHA